MSTLFGIYNAQRSLSLNQAVMDIINNNIANINTPGYSKQRAEISQLTSGNISTIPQNAAQDSMGAVIDAITRNRDLFLDNYYREEKSSLSYYQELSENADLIEDITNELDNTGIGSSLNELYLSLSQLSANANDFVLRNNVIQKAVELSTKFNSIYSQLENQRTNLVGDYTQPDTLDGSKVKIISDDLNDKLNSIADLNNSIILATAEGTSPNFLLDNRDTLLDEISQYIPADIKQEINGSVTISLGNTLLVSGKTQTGFFSVTSGDIDNPATLQIENPTGGVLVADAYSLVSSGQLGAVLEMGGSEANELTIKSVMDNLDTLAYELANTINNLQISGQYMVENPAGSGIYELTNGDDILTVPIETPPYFFVDDATAGTIPATAAGFAKLICINDAIADDPYQISAASATAGIEETGDGANALLMSQARNSVIAGLGGATTDQYLINMVSDVGSKANRISTNYEIKENISQQLKMKRESVIGVNLDEEMADLIRFQRSYEASARVFSAVNDNIKTILAMMG
ncbi:MAG: flagellar hook-associated protein FlgK [Candidatus Melainabacteria bacterium GWF2_37_15]|nr:MAG: flagellar hook-associated protein FlgK [Candidatus Melainabacteria bacterium GWF2_37_15]